MSNTKDKDWKGVIDADGEHKERKGRHVTVRVNEKPTAKWLAQQAKFKRPIMRELAYK